MIGVNIFVSKHHETIIYIQLVCLFIAAQWQLVLNSSLNKSEVNFQKESAFYYWSSYDGPYLDDNYVIKSQGCYIPSYDFLDNSIKSFVSYPTLPACPGSMFPLLERNRTHLWIVHKNYNRYTNLTGVQLSCCYKVFYPKPSKSVKEARDKHIYLECIEFTDHVAIMYEFIRALCYLVPAGGKNVTVFDQFYVFSQRKSFTSYRQRPFLQEYDGYNVLILGLRSVSRVNFVRTMPNTVKFLRDSGAIDFLGYNVADDKISSLISATVGLNYEELRETSWSDSRSMSETCPFIWERFKDAGYYTALAEDTSTQSIFGTLENDKNGFKHCPTDYYLQPFITAADSIKHKNFQKCMGNNYYFQVLLDYLDGLTVTLKHYKFFGLFLESSMTYDNLNYPMFMDYNYLQLLEKLNTSRYLKNTFLILVSDNGMKYGNIAKTKLGPTESNLPLLYILPPPSFKRKYSFAYSNLEKNKYRLTTPYDLHGTLIDLLDLRSVQDKELIARSRRFNFWESNEISLFLSVPKVRTCTSAGIKNKTCTCVNMKKLGAEDPLAQTGAAIMMSALNRILAAYPQCSYLLLIKIIDAKLMSNYGSDEIGAKLWLIIRVAPKGAVFEATLHLKKNRWEVNGMISRLNYVNSNTQCVKDDHIKTYCHCLREFRHMYESNKGHGKHDHN